MSYKISQKDVWSEAGSQWKSQQLEEMSESELTDLLVATYNELRDVKGVDYYKLENLFYALESLKEN